MERVLSRISRKGLTTIPAEIRRLMNVEEGDLLAWSVDKERGVVIVEVVKDPLKRLRGKYSRPDLRYEEVEELGDKLLEEETNASD